MLLQFIVQNINDSYIILFDKTDDPLGETETDCVGKGKIESKIYIEIVNNIHVFLLFFLE